MVVPDNSVPSPPLVMPDEDQIGALAENGIDKNGMEVDGDGDGDSMEDFDMDDLEGDEDAIEDDEMEDSDGEDEEESEMETDSGEDESEEVEDDEVDMDDEEDEQSISPRGSDEFAGIEDYQEHLSEYGLNGYMPVDISQKIQDYIVIRKSGVGSYSTVWMAYHSEKEEFFALKVSKAKERCVEHSKQEFLMLKKISEQSKRRLGYNRVIHAIDFFLVDKDDQVHGVTVFDSVGVTLLPLIEKSPDGLEVEPLQKIARQVFEGLSFLHDHCKIIHSDIKCENMILTLPRKRKYGVVRKVMEANFRGKGMTMHADRSFFTKLNRKGLTKIFERILDDYNDTSACPIGQIYDSSKTKEINLELLSQPPVVKKKEPDYFSCYSVSKRDVERRMVAAGNEVSNFIMDPEVNVKIIDLGGSIQMEKSTKSSVDTFEYRAPEVILNGDCTPAADIWSFGCTFFEIATSRQLFQSNRDSELGDVNLVNEILSSVESDDNSMTTALNDCPDFDKYFSPKGDPKHHLLPEQAQVHTLKEKLESCLVSEEERQLMVSLMKHMMKLDPSKRSTAKELLSHPFLKH